ncbi:MAG: hypothetical protein NTZ67_09430 [Gammaproteobacteria bacterium]|nr:hypothetical protein [Gammaproteobacteria bacterium]
MLSFLLKTLSCIPHEDFYSNPDPHLFIENFQKKDIAALILSCAAGHPPVPEQASGEMRDQCRTEFSELPEDEEKVNTDVDHDHCTVDEYYRLAKLAKKHGIFHHETKPDRAIPVAYQVCHVKIASVKMQSEPLGSDQSKQYFGN